LALALVIPACSTATSSTTAPPLSSDSTEPATANSTASTTSLPDEIDLVALGDSFVAWSDWPEILSDDLAALRGVQVHLDDTLAKPGSLAAFEPDLLSTDTAARTTIAGAEILILQPRPLFAPPAMAAFVADECGDAAECLDTALDEMRTYTEDYLDLVGTLIGADTEVAVVLVGSWPVDAIYPGLRLDDEAGLVRLSTFMFDLMRVVETAAEARGMAVVDVGAVFNGADYLDSMDPDYLVADGLHLSEAGSRVVADELLAVLEPNR
jgi:hypothetical protein